MHNTWEGDITENKAKCKMDDTHSVLNHANSNVALQ